MMVHPPVAKVRRISYHGSISRRRRENETDEQRDMRLREMRLRAMDRRGRETSEERERRLETQRMRRHWNRVEESQPSRETRLSQRREVLRRLPRCSQTSQEHYAGKQNNTCPHCSAQFFDEERNARNGFSSCCGVGGKVALPYPSNYPTLLKCLLCGEHEMSKNFMENIRSYNSSLAFASMGANLESPSGYGPYCFKIHGQIYHRTGALLPDPGQHPLFGQLYILDTTEATAHRVSNEKNAGCNQMLLAELDQLLRAINPYAQAYKTMHTVLTEEITEHGLSSAPEVKMVLFDDRSKDKRRYNLPTANEVAAIFKTNDGFSTSERDLVIYPRSGNLKRLSYTQSSCDPMTYPLLFPDGEPGWNPSMECQGGFHPSICQFYSYKLFERKCGAVKDFNPLLHAGKLTQQFVVDSYVKIEGTRLSYLRQGNFQNKLRSEFYQGLVDFVSLKAENQGIRPGRPVILPSSFIGGPRSLIQRYQDSMAIVKHFGKPTYFMTFTCNPKWREILETIEPWEQPSDRPDIVARVFHIKLKALLCDILKRDLLGKVEAYTYSIEFQKRGLPHCHALFILERGTGPRTGEDIDKVVSAELPDPKLFPDLYNVVTSFMVHGPCGCINPKCVCMDNGKCTKGFPKPLRETTDPNVDGYPLYRRRCLIGPVTIGKYQVDDRWVVPYNKELLLRYNAHINLEICSTVKSVKYIYKYIHKKGDAAVVKFTSNGEGELVWNEIDSFLDARYLSAPEAMWRILKYEVQKESHTVYRLPVHLPRHQIIQFQEGKEEEALARAALRTTKLTAWFELNARDENARNFTYCEIPLHYTFSSNGMWVARKNFCSNVISRIYSVPATDVERFHLRLLLLHVKGATSFESLRTIDSELHPSFLEAAKAAGLVKNDQEWESALEEAANFQMPRQMRQTFAYICIFCHPTNAKELWEKFCIAMSEDFLHQGDTNTEALNKALQCIDEVLAIHRVSCEQLGLPKPQTRIRSMPSFSAEIERQKAQDNMALLNQEQLTAFQAIIHAVENPQTKEKYFHLVGIGGCGKTFVLSTVLNYIRGKGMTAVPMAWTGIATTLLEGSRTVHGWFLLPIPITQNSTSDLRDGTILANFIKTASLIVWDEISMTPLNAFNAVDRTLRDLKQCNEPFGGVPVVVAGDFRQQLPVVKRGSRTAIVENCVKSSQLWSKFKMLKLTVNNRLAKEETEFAAWLVKLGNGEKLSPQELSENVVEIPPEILSTGSIVEEIFGDINHVDSKTLKGRAILCPKNEDCFKINDNILQNMDGASLEYLSADSIDSDNGDELDTERFPAEFLNAQTPSGMPPHSLKLKEGAVVILLRNLNPKEGLFNGTRMIVKTLKPRLIVGEILNGNFAGNLVIIPRIELAPMDDELPFVLRRRQLPVRLAFAMSITKSQGQSLEKVGIYLPQPVFAHGQLYVALSRARSYSGVRIKVLDSQLQGKLLPKSHNVFAQNLVYKEIL